LLKLETFSHLAVATCRLLRRPYSASTPGLGYTQTDRQTDCSNHRRLGEGHS